MAARRHGKGVAAVMDLPFDRHAAEREFLAADVWRALANIVREGTVAAVEGYRVRARYHTAGDGAAQLTAWRPWIAPRAGDAAEWDPPSVGERVLLLSPGGDLATGFALGGLFDAGNPPPSAGRVFKRVFDDGAVVSYDPEAHALAALLPSGATVRVEGDIILDGDVGVTGDLDVDGAILGATVADADGGMGEVRSTYNGHTHPVAGNLANAPNQKMT